MDIFEVWSNKIEVTWNRMTRVINKFKLSERKLDMTWICKLNEFEYGIEIWSELSDELI